jgi:hypothetical protein
MSSVIKELLTIIAEAKKDPAKKVTKKAAQKVYHRDYLRTKKKPYRQYKPEDEKQ